MMTLNHGLSGYVCGQLAMPLLKRHAPVPPRLLSAAFFLGAMAPDTDILVRWLAGRGAYFSAEWYAHRAASHSVLGTLLLGMGVAALLYAPHRLRAARGGAAGAALPAAVPRVPVGFAWLAACGWAGGLLHILGDLFTPRLPMPVFWPWPERFGALSHIGWFSPYLLWLFLATMLLGWAGAALLPRVPALRASAPAILWGLYALAAYRWVHYLLGSRYESWSQWDAFQRSLLPDWMITPLAHGVHALWHWFTR